MRAIFAKRGLVLSVALFLAIISAAYAQDVAYSDFDLIFTGEQGNVKTDIILHVEIQDYQTNTLQKFDKYAPDGILHMRLLDGKYKLTILGRDQQKNFYNHFAEKDINTVTIVNNDTVIMIPVAYVTGVVVDEDENLISGSILKYECAGNTFLGQVKTDAFGSFSINYIPFGKCKIFATSHDSIATMEIVVSESKIYDVKILMQNKAKIIDGSKKTPSWIYIAGFLVIILAAIFLSYYMTKGPKSEKNKIDEQIAFEKNEQEKETGPGNPAENPKAMAELPVTPQMRAIINTLDEYEKEVVRFLLKNNGSTTQNKIRYETGIPKTSLFRCLQRLEHKKIIKATSIGKMKKIELSDFFLNK